MVLKLGLKRLVNGLTALALVASIATQVFFPGTAFAAQAIGTPRSLTLENGATDGGSKPSGTVTHDFKFSLDDNSTANQVYGSISFQYCTTADPVPTGIGCYAPAGISVNAATIAAENGTIKNWKVLSKTANEDASDPNKGAINTVTLEPTSGTTFTVSTPTTIDEALGSIVNPSAANTTFYVRISAYSSLDGTGTASDTGTVAASTADAITLTGYMPESLVFCTGQYINISGVTGLPDCSTSTGGAVSFNQLFNPNTTTWATSQMAASTNANQGYVITVSGTTLYSGTTPITAIGATAGDSVPGTAQFGMNLIDDLTPAAPTVTDPHIGTGKANPVVYYEANGTTVDPNGGKLFPVSDKNNYTGLVTTGASGFDGTNDTVNHYPTYSFSATAQGAPTPVLNTVAKSDDTTGGTTGPTNAQRYTSTYIVNVPGNQPAGTYVTTLTYICTPTF